MSDKSQWERGNLVNNDLGVSKIPYAIGADQSARIASLKNGYLKTVIGTSTEMLAPFVARSKNSLSSGARPLESIEIDGITSYEGLYIMDIILLNFPGLWKDRVIPDPIMGAEIPQLIVKTDPDDPETTKVIEDAQRPVRFYRDSQGVEKLLFDLGSATEEGRAYYLMLEETGPAFGDPSIEFVHISQKLNEDYDVLGLKYQTEEQLEEAGHMIKATGGQSSIAIPRVFEADREVKHLVKLGDHYLN